MSYAIAIPLALAAASSLPDVPEDAPSVLRVYDVTIAAPLGERQDGSAIQPIHLSMDSWGELASAVRGREVCLEVLNNLQQDQWQVADRSLEIQNDGRLQVLAPPALQDSVVASLDFMAGTFGRETRLLVDVVTMKTADADTIPALVAVGDIDRWVGLSSAHQAHEISALAGANGWMRALRRIETVNRYEGMLAERSALFQAQLDEVSAGLSIESALTPAPGGAWLAVNVQDVRQAGEIEEIESRNNARITTDSSVVPDRGPSRAQSLRLDEVVCALNTFVPDGKALVVRATTSPKAGTARVLFVRPADPMGGAITRLSENAQRLVGTTNAAFIRSDAYELPLVDLRNRDGAAGLKSLARFSDADDTVPYARPILEFGSGYVLESHLSQSDTTWYTSAGVWSVLYGPDRAAIDATLSRVSSLMPEPRVIGVTLTLQRGTRDTAVLARASAVVRAGARSTLMVGQESTQPRGPQGEVAQGLSMTFPRVTTAFEGFAVALSPHTVTGGGWTIGIDVHARAARGPAREFDSGAGNLPLVHQQDADLLDLERNIVIGAAQGKPQRIVLGNAGTSDEALTLVVEVTDVR